MMRVSGENAAMSSAVLQKNIRRLYEGATPQGVRFRYGLLAFDIVTVLFIIATSFLPSNDITEIGRAFDTSTKAQRRKVFASATRCWHSIS